MKMTFPKSNSSKLNTFFDELRNTKVNDLTKEESKEYWHNILDYPSCSDWTKCPKCGKEYTTSTCFCLGQIECDCGHKFYDGEIRRERFKQSIINKRKVKK